MATEKNLEKVDVITTKHDELSNKLCYHLQERKRSGESQQGAPEKKRKGQGVHQTDKAICQNVSSDQTRESNGKDLNRDQLLVQGDAYVNSKKKGGKGSEKPKEKVNK